jgi:hypothetical protein
MRHGWVPQLQLRALAFLRAAWLQLRSLRAGPCGAPRPRLLANRRQQNRHAARGARPSVVSPKQPSLLLQQVSVARLRIEMAALPALYPLQPQTHTPLRW